MGTTVTPTLNLFVGQTKTPVFDILAPSGAPNPPVLPEITGLNAGVATAVVGAETVNTTDPTKWTVPIAFTGQSVGDTGGGVSIAGVDQNQPFNVVVSPPPPDTGVWDQSTFS